MDLGIAMVRTGWRSLWSAWLAVYAPAALALGLAFRDEPWIGALLLWWAKPVFDRFALHILSRSVFGEAARLRDTLGGWREILRPGVLASLTTQRLNPARSFVLPVWQLERQSGTAAAQRRGVLQRRAWAYAAWLTVICVHFETAVLLSAGSVLDLFVPARADAGFDASDLFSGASWLAAWTSADTALYALAVSAVEPFYVAAGFSLYLDRRMRLEGWDIEVALRRLASRLGKVGAIVLAGLVFSSALFCAPTTAQAAPAAPKQEIAEVLKAPEFQTQRETVTWQYRSGASDKRESIDREFWTAVAKVLAQAAQFLGWAALGMLVIVSIWFAQRLLPAAADATAPAPALAGPVAKRRAEGPGLPADPAAAALLLAREGRVREALSLLYRGALAAMSGGNGAGVASGDTESDCLRRSAGALAGPTYAYFGELVACWQRAAYSAAPPDAERVIALCIAWPRHFRARAQTSAS
jgi:hypothetical protein